MSRFCISCLLVFSLLLYFCYFSCLLCLPKYFRSHILFAFAIRQVVCLSVRPQPPSPAFTSQTAGPISPKHHRSDQYQPCAFRRHVPLGCTKWPPQLKVEKPCPAFKSQTTGPVSTNLNRCDQY